MRLALVFAAALLLPALTACDSAAPPAKAPVSTPAVKAPAVKTPTATTPATTPAKFPAAARPLLGTWAADLANCGTDSVTTVTATAYETGGKSCKLALTDNRDGSFAASCGNQQMTMIPVFAPSGEGINIKAGSAKQTTVLRCSR